MRCPDCQNDDTRVVDSRTAGDGIRRRRQCGACGIRFTTQERIEARLPWVGKKLGSREPFSRDKVLHGIALACRKRPLTADDLDAAVRCVEASLVALRVSEVSTAQVGEAVMRVLRELDSVAYVRFASVYGAFESVEQFAEVISPLTEGGQLTHPRSEDAR